MTEFLTWNAYRAVQDDYIMQVMWLLLPTITCLLAIVVSLFLDKYGAPDDDFCFDPRYYL